MLQHYRQGIQDFVLEVPGGVIDPGEAPEQTVERELREELGLAGATFHKTGVTYTNPSMLTNKDHRFLAIGGIFGEQKIEAGDTFQMVKMPFAELLASINDP